MSKVVNDIVKLDWEKRNWVQAKKGPFLYACQEYTNDDGVVIPVYFDAESAFVWGDNMGTDDEDLWSASELKDWVKSNYSDTFPVLYDSYVPIITAGYSECSESMLEKYKLTQFKDDIEARFKDLLAFNEEKEITL